MEQLAEHGITTTETRAAPAKDNHNVTSTQDPKSSSASTTALSDERRGILARLGLMHETDVCTLCGVKSETLWTWRSQGRGPSYVKLGREVCYRVDDLLKWISNNVVEFIQAETVPVAANDAMAAVAVA